MHEMTFFPKAVSFRGCAILNSALPRKTLLGFFAGGSKNKARLVVQHVVLDRWSTTSTPSTRDWASADPSAGNRRRIAPAHGLDARSNSRKSNITPALGAWVGLSSALGQEGRDPRCSSLFVLRALGTESAKHWLTCLLLPLRPSSCAEGVGSHDQASSVLFRTQDPGSRLAEIVCRRRGYDDGSLWVRPSSLILWWYQADPSCVQLHRCRCQYRHQRHGMQGLAWHGRGRVYVDLQGLGDEAIQERGR